MKYPRRGGGDPEAAELVLRGLSFEVHPGEWVSVVGRTGAGKSSLLAAMLRIAEPCGGRVLIDGVDLASVPLRTLRKRICIIPQAGQYKTSSAMSSIQFTSQPFIAGPAFYFWHTA
jgi:ABC-type multidrug transport system fused ATPase/permease subunit